MANEQKQNWALSSVKEWHIGHYHHLEVNEYNGVRVRTLSSLVPADQWHASKGYIGALRSAQAFLYDEKQGLIAIFYHNIL